MGCYDVNMHSPSTIPSPRLDVSARSSPSSCLLHLLLLILLITITIIISLCCRLRVLELSDCLNISICALRSISSLADTLESLSLKNSSQLDAEAFLQVCLPSLQLSC